MFLLCAGRQQSDGLIFHTADDVPADAAVPQGSGNGHAGAAWSRGITAPIHAVSARVAAVLADGCCGAR